MPFLVGGPCKGCGLPLALADVTGVTCTCPLDPTVTQLVQKPGTWWLRGCRREK